MRKHLTAASVGLGTALVLTGCVAFKGEIEGEQVSKEKVQINFELCSDGPFAGGGCFSGSRAERERTKLLRQRGAGASEETRVLVAFKVRKGTPPRRGFSPTDYDLLFSFSESYSRQLNLKAPRRSTQRWFGYVSEPLPDDAPSDANFRVRFRLADRPTGQFNYRPVTGYLDGEPMSRIGCGRDPFTTKSFGGGATQIRCIDDPSRDETSRNLPIPLD